MAIKILINGAFGRMGQISVHAIKNHADFELVGQTSRDYNLAQSIKDSQAEVVIDFTHPKSVFENANIIIENNARPIIGTSGLTTAEIKQLQKKCDEKKLGGIIAPNFSLGAVLMMKYAKEIVKYMPNVEIIEMHHQGKADSPSGTAMRTAELLAAGNSKVNANTTSAHENVAGARGATYQNIPIHAVRLPGFLAHEQIVFGEQGETLSLTHNSIDRQCFMPGLCLACEKVMHLQTLIYGLEEVL